jgi:hypothetical protein
MSTQHIAYGLVRDIVTEISQRHIEGPLDAANGAQRDDGRMEGWSFLQICRYLIHDRDTNTRSPFAR